MLKKILSVLFLSLCLSVKAFSQTDFDNVPWQDIKLDYSALTQANHPRLFLDAKEFPKFKKKALKEGYLGSLHKQMMEVAEESLAAEEPLEYKKDASGKRILYVARDAMIRIVSLTYAYRMTGNKSYLKKAEWNMNVICDFPDWNPSHFLDPCEMSFGLAIAYDWMYDKLSAQTKDKVADRLQRFAMEEAVHGIGQHIFRRTGNWNQVCIACLTADAIATYERNPELSKEVICRGLEGNIPEMKAIYGPNGAFPEGPGYWEYGTCYQEYLLLLYESAFGTDFGLSKVAGFSNTGWFKAFCRSSAGHIFNYSDNSDRTCPSPGLWYLAWKFNCPGILADELPFLDTGEYKKERRLILALISAYKLGNVKVGSPEGRMFFDDGSNPILIARTGWTPDDAYLGLKGGRADIGHSHMDAGSFVFDAYGSRWACDYYVRNYQKMELIWQKLGLEKKQYAFTQDSYRWYLFDHNNRQHNTLTVNGKNHFVNGFAPITQRWDTQDRLGGKIDLTEIFGGDLKKAVRSVSIRDGACLEVEDSLSSRADSSAHVRWTLVTGAKVRIETDRILLSDGKTTMCLRTDAPGAVFKMWSSNPKDYDSPTAFGEDKFKKTYICGYEFDIPAGSDIKVTTTLKKKQ